MNTSTSEKLGMGGWFVLNSIIAIVIYNLIQGVSALQTILPVWLLAAQMASFIPILAACYIYKIPHFFSLTIGLFLLFLLQLGLSQSLGIELAPVAPSSERSSLLVNGHNAIVSSIKGLFWMLACGSILGGIGSIFAIAIRPQKDKPLTSTKVDLKKDTRGRNWQ